MRTFTRGSRYADTVVDYPILQSAEDNLVFIRSYGGQRRGTATRSIYTENLNRIDFTDKNTVRSTDTT